MLARLESTFRLSAWALTLVGGLLAPAPARATTVATATVGDPVVRPGPWKPDTLPPDWVLVESPHDQVQAQIDGQRARLTPAAPREGRSGAGERN